MSKLHYRNLSHNQEAELYIGGRLIARFSATVDGTSLPTYSAWLATDVTEEDYQAHHEDIHRAYIEFVHKQSVNEAKLIDRIQADKEADQPEEPSTVEEPAQSEPRVDEPDQPEPRVEEPDQPEPRVEEPGQSEPRVDEPAQPEPRVEEPSQPELTVEELAQPEVNQSGDNTPQVEE